MVHLLEKISRLKSEIGEIDTILNDALHYRLKNEKVFFDRPGDRNAIEYTFDDLGVDKASMEAWAKGRLRVRRAELERQLASLLEQAKQSL